MKFKRLTQVLAFGLLACCVESTFADSSSQDAAVEPLRQARMDLMMSEVTLRRIERNLKDLRDDSYADPMAVADYARYLEAVRGMMERQRRVVQEMESLHGDVPIVRGGEWPEAEPSDFRPVIATATDELTLLERELAGSLAAFDDFLLRAQHEATRRMEQIDAASSAEMTDLAQEAAAAVERLRDRGIDVDTSAPPGSPGGPGAPSEEQDGELKEGPCEGEECTGCTECTEGETQPGGPGDDGTGEPGGEQTDAEGGMSGGSSSGTGEGVDSPNGETGSPGAGGSTIPPPANRPPASDDDIVARQLREAAERETDPVLKEKLWQEYDRYKGSK